MKTYIDLLPEKKREELRNGNLVRRIIWQEIGLAFPVVLLAAYLIAVNLVLNIQLKSEEDISSREVATPGQVEISGYEKRFEEINRKIGTINKISSKHLNWNVALRKLVELVPGHVYLKSVETRDYHVSILGWAKERQDFLDFQNSLTGSDCFENIKDPLSNLVSKNNLDFTLEFDVKKECLAKYE